MKAAKGGLLLPREKCCCRHLGLRVCVHLLVVAPATAVAVAVAVALVAAEVVSLIVVVVIIIMTSTRIRIMCVLSVGGGRQDERGGDGKEGTACNSWH